jgi:hypothetical protein
MRNSSKPQCSFALLRLVKGRYAGNAFVHAAPVMDHGPVALRDQCVTQTVWVQERAPFLPPS